MWHIYWKSVDKSQLRQCVKYILKISRQELTKTVWVRYILKNQWTEIDSSLAEWIGEDDPSPKNTESRSRMFWAERRMTVTRHKHRLFWGRSTKKKEADKSSPPRQLVKNILEILCKLQLLVATIKQISTDNVKWTEGGLKCKKKV